MNTTSNTEMKTRIDKFLISISIAFVLIIVGLLYFNPETSQKVANAIFSTMTNWFGSMTLVFILILAVGRRRIEQVRQNQARRHGTGAQHF